MKFIYKQMNKKGFSLIELIVVIAILAIIAAVAIPRFAGIQARSEIKADSTTGSEIISALRIYMADVKTAPMPADLATARDVLSVGEYMEVPDISQSGSAWEINLNTTGVEATIAGQPVPDGMMYVTWTPTDIKYATLQVVIENAPFELVEVP